jgi:uncharacterized membrane protein
MNEQERTELEWLKRRQTRLLEEVQTLSKQIDAVEKRLIRTQEEVLPAARTGEPTPTKEPLTPSLAQRERETAPVPPSGAKEPAAPERVTQQREAAAPAAIPPIIQTAESGPAPKPAQTPIPAAAMPKAQSTREEPGKSAPVGQRARPEPVAYSPSPVSPTVAAPPPTGKKPDAASFEMRLGTYWLVRIGIVMLVTGLVFFGNLAYHHIISRIGPAGKIALLYLASTLLLGAGWWWQRKPVKESLKNYAEVLFAGGLASVYFTTFAAHHIERLQIIKSPGLDGALLLIWAGFIVWIADRKKSQVLALFAVLLAYYSLIITRVEVFTLYSNLVLTGAAVFFLVRNRWAVLSFVGLGATYAAYGYWRFCNGQEWHFPGATDVALWKGIWFLIGYWVIFTAGVFLTRDKEFAGAHRTSFLTANNGAFFAMFLLTMMQVHQGGFWKFSLFYGSALLGLAVVARAMLPDEPLVKNSYLTQGLLLATVGIICHPDLAGLNLALILATESVTLLFTGQLRKNRVLLVGAYLAAILAVGWGMDGMMQHEKHGMWLAIGLGFLMLVNTLLADWDLRRQAVGGREAVNGGGVGTAIQRRGGAPARRVLLPQPAYFIVLALAVWLVATWNNAGRANFTFVLTIEAVASMLSIYLLRVPELPLLSVGYLGIAQLVWFYDAFNGQLVLPHWNPVVILAINLAVVVWWRRQTVLEYEPRSDLGWFTPGNLAVPGKNVVLLAAMHIAVKLAGGWDFGVAPPVNTSGLWLPIVLGAIILMDSVLHSHRSPGSVIGLQSAYSTILALCVGFAATWHHTSREAFPLVLACEAVALTASYYLLRVPEITLFGQSYLLIAQIAWMAYFGIDHHHLPPWWNPVLLIGISLAVSHWWQKQKVLSLSSGAGLLWQGVYALAIVGVLYYWGSGHVEAPTWLALTTLLAVVLTAYGAMTRAWLLAAFGQIFMIISAVQFVLQLAQGKPSWWLPLAPMAGIAALVYGTVKWFEQRPDANEQVREPLLQVALVYRWTAMIMSVCWVCKYIPERERVWFFVLPGLFTFLLGGWRKSVEVLVWGAVYTACAIVWLWLPGHENSIVYAPNFVAVAVVLAQQRIAKLFAGRYPLSSQVHGTVITIGGVSLWFLVTRWVWEVAEQDPKLAGLMTASWCGLALVLFTCGIVTRERVYRWLGLAVLTCSLARVVFSDVWRIEQPIYRVLSFMALGVVLLVLGFIYNKYQEKIKQWL